MKLAIARIFPAKFQTFVPAFETNSIHTTRKIHIITPSKHFMAFVTAFLQKQLPLLSTG